MGVAKGSDLPFSGGGVGCGGGSGYGEKQGRSEGSLTTHSPQNKNISLRKAWSASRLQTIGYGSNLKIR